MKSRGTHDSADSSRELARRVGDRIRAIRRERHLTQVELARRVGIRAGPMNQIERGRHVPSGRVLYALANILDVPADDLFGRTAGSTASSADPAWPARFLPALDAEAPGRGGLALAEGIARDFLALEDLCGAMKQAAIPLFVPFVPTTEGLDLLATRVRHHLGITNAVVFDYIELMENAGLRVIFCGLPRGTPSLCAFDRRNGNAFFFIRRGLTAERQLFRLVFELGRIYLHTRGVYAIPGDEPPGSLDETHAARKFAALFLMPEAAVRGSVSQLGVRATDWTYELLLRIKHRFGVSAESFAIRLEELFLIDPALSRRFKIRIRAYYRQTDHREPDGSLRRLCHNGRLGDLLLTAAARMGARAEVSEIVQRFKRLGISSLVFDSHGKRTMVREHDKRAVRGQLGKNRRLKS